MIIKPVLLIVEGSADASRILRALPEPVTDCVEIIAAGGWRGVQHSCRALSGGARPLLGIRDRDLMEDDEVEALARTHPDVFVWPGRCLESDLLDPSFLTAAVRSAGSQVDELMVRGRLRALAGEQLEQIVADLTDRRLRRQVSDEPEKPDDLYLPPERKAPGRMTPGERLQVQLYRHLDLAGRRVEAYDETRSQVIAELDARFERDHLELLDAKRALGQLGDIRPFRHTSLLEDCLFKRIRDGHPSPGFRALVRRIGALVAAAN